MAQRRQTRNPRITAQAKEAGTDGVQLDAVVGDVLPFIPGAVRTLGLAAQPRKGKDGVSEEPGDTKAASTLIELSMKYMTGTSSSRAMEVINRIREMQEAALAATNAPADG